MSDEFCKEPVCTRHSFRAYRCSRKAVKDGYCKQHHPDTVRDRREKLQKRYEEQRKNTPWYRLEKAEKRIAELKLALVSIDGCFEAALIEGWSEALSDGDIERIRDIFARRIGYARSICLAAMASKEEE